MLAQAPACVPSLLKHPAPSSSCAGWHTGTPGLPSSSLSYSAENIGMSPVTVKSDDRIRTPKSSKLLPKLPLALFLDMSKPNLPGIQTQYTTHCLHLQLLLGLQGPPGAASQSRWSYSGLRVGEVRTSLEVSHAQYCLWKASLHSPQKTSQSEQNCK